MTDLPRHRPAPAAHRRWRAPLIAQCAGLSIGFAALAITPPASGAMLLLPLAGNGGEIVNVALANGARLLGAGPVRGSIMVTGRRDALVGAMLRHGTLTLAAAPRWCGQPGRTVAAVRA